MADIVFICATLAFFALCAVYVRACDGIVRSTEAPTGVTEGEDASSALPAARS